MKKPVKKTASKTDDLLKRLGASLRESPLNAHARGTGSESQVVRPSEQAGGYASTAVMASTQSRSATQGIDFGNTRAVTLETAPVDAKNSSAANTGEGRAAVSQMQAQMRTQVEKSTGMSLKAVMEESARRADASVKEKVQEKLKAQTPAAMNSEGIFGKTAKRSATVMANERPTDDMKKSALSFAEGVTEVAGRSAAALTSEQVQALQNAPTQVKNAVRMQDGLPAPESLQHALEKLGMPMDERQMMQLKEIETMREAIAELKKLQAQAATSTTAPAMQNYAGGSHRATVSGWKTSTIGLYPEDYERAYDLMNYLRAQTGQAVNLSRVIKIALRALEVGPRVLEINEQIRAKDGRLMSRRG